MFIINGMKKVMAFLLILTIITSLFAFPSTIFSLAKSKLFIEDGRSVSMWRNKIVYIKDDDADNKSLIILRSITTGEEKELTSYDTDRYKINEGEDYYYKQVIDTSIFGDKVAVSVKTWRRYLHNGEHEAHQVYSNDVDVINLNDGTIDNLDDSTLKGEMSHPVLSEDVLYFKIEYDNPEEGGIGSFNLNSRETKQLIGRKNKYRAIPTSFYKDKLYYEYALTEQYGGGNSADIYALDITTMKKEPVIQGEINDLNAKRWGNNIYYLVWDSRGEYATYAFIKRLNLDSNTITEVYKTKNPTLNMDIYDDKFVFDQYIGQNAQRDIAGIYFGTFDNNDPEVRSLSTTSQFDPDLDQQSKLKFNINETSKIKAYVYKGNEKVASLKAKTFKKGQIKLFWNGKKNGKSLDKGTYSYVFYVTDKLGNRARHDKKSRFAKRLIFKIR